MNQMSTTYRLGVDIGSTTVKVAVLDQENRILFSDYERHYANIQETLAKLLKKAVSQTGDILVIPVITGSGGLTLSSHLHIPFVQEVVAVASSLQDLSLIHILKAWKVWISTKKSVLTGSFWD